MLKTSDDLPKLFRSLGNNDATSRSVNSMASRDAEQRWPLLKAMPPKEPPQAPPLTDDERQSWQSQAHAEYAERDPAPSPPSLGDKLALSLKKIAVQAKTEQTPKKSRAKPAVATAVPVQESTLAQTPHKVSMPGLTSSPQDASQPTRPMKTTVQIPGLTDIKSDYQPDISPGAIWGKKEAGAEPVAAHTLLADDSLKSIFSRLEPVKKEPTPPTSEKRPSYLGRLGRK